MLTILFDGIAYGMLLFVLACGLAVTLGLMNFVNLAHGSFAMAGGYITLILVNRNGIPFFAALPIAFFVVAALDYVMGSQQQYIQLPSMLQGQLNLFGINVGKYRLLIIVMCGLLTVAL